MIQETSTSNRSLLLSLFFIGLFGIAGKVILGPIIAPLIINDQFIVPSLFNTPNAKSALIGVILAIFPFFIIFSAPFFGKVVGFIGSKKALYLSLCFYFLSDILMVFGLIYLNLVIVIVSQVIGGLSGGISTPIKPIISQISDSTNRNKNFSIIASYTSMVFLLSNMIAAEFSHERITNVFSIAMPYFVIVFLQIIAFVLIALFIPEFKQTKIPITFNILGTIKEIKNAFNVIQLRKIFIIIILYTASWNIFIQFLQVYLAKDFNEDTLYIARLYAFIGVWMILIQFGILRPFSNLLKPKKSLSIILPLLGVSILLVLIPSTYKEFYFFVPLIAIFQAFIQTLLITAIVENAPKEMAITCHSHHRSMQAIGEFLGPIAGSIVALFSLKLTFAISSFIMLLAYVFWCKFVKEKIGQE